MMQAVYDLRTSPVTFDFVHWLANVERQRLASGESAVHVVFVQGDRQRTARDIAFSPARKAWRLHHLLGPLCRLLPSCTRYSFADEGEQTIPYAPSCFQGVYLNATDAAHDLAASWTRTNQPIVTITIRQSDFQTVRNSNRPEWRIIADWLQAQGCLPIIVPDTEAVLSGEACPEFDGLRVCLPAALEPDIRLALYQRAVLNLFTSGGPFALALSSGAPMLLCKVITPSVPTCTEAYQRTIGLTPATPLNPYQQVAWVEDTAEALLPILDPLLKTCRARERPLGPVYGFACRKEARITHMQQAMHQGYLTMEAVPRHDRALAVVCYGPSLHDTWRHLATQPHDILTVSGAYAFLRARGITPAFHVESDPRPHKAGLLDLIDPATLFYLSSACHPSVFAKVPKESVRLWHAVDSEAFEAALLAEDPNAFLIHGGSTVGLRALMLGGALGYRKFSIYGMDCSLANGQRHAGPHTGKVQTVVRVTTAGSDRYFDSTAQMISSAREFLGEAHKYAPHGYQFDIYGEGLLAEMSRLATQPQEELCPQP